ncbi:MAG: class I SAM-dependent rRNA methyltransferase [Oscillospiraceae bacterium]|jgi:23S rRNA (cytosine1962-C5)-methyltransferase|nr:class I SAM-dependent rRNA methyltransferase [Oscillospiraceae bacterium]
MLNITLLPDKEKRIYGGHPWIFKSDIARTANDSDWRAEAPLARVMTSRGKFAAIALHNPASQIALRVITQRDEAIDEAFFGRKVHAAVEFRRQFRHADLESCRLIYAESDGLPALICDRFGDVIVFQSMSLGIEAYKRCIIDAVTQETGVRNVWERSDAPVRNLEGLPMVSALYAGEVPDMVDFQENGVKFRIDVKNGQKTGYFLDQKENRAAIARYVQDSRVLDCFTHVGSFALHAAKYGAAQVVGVDISDSAVAMAEENCRLNGFDNVAFETANAFDYLRNLSAGQFDVIILDPPAFTKTRGALDNALRGYKEINLRAMKLLRGGGILVTCSCSQHVDGAAFGSMLHAAARDAKVTLRVLDKRGAAPDHPVLMGARETEYLKFWICDVG